MTSDDLRNIYRKRSESYLNAISHRNRLINYISLLRFLTVVAAIYFLITAIKNDQPVFYFGTFMMISTFFILVSYHKRHRDRREILRELRKLNETELNCLDHRYDENPDGSGFVEKHHPWTGDIDVFGPGSLYQYLNRTSTIKGEKILASSMSNSPLVKEEIYERQDIIRDLSNRIDYRQIYTARARLIRENPSDFEEIQSWIERDGYILKNRWLLPVAIFTSVLSIAVIVYGIIQPSGFRFLLPILFINWGLLVPFLMRTNHYQSSISKKANLLDGYASLLKTIGETPFNHSTLLFYQDHASEGFEEIKKLSSLINLFDQRLNLIIGTLLNSLFLFDFFMLFLLEKWKTRNSNKIESWIELTGWMEAMISLAGFAYNHPGYVFPDISDKDTSFLAESMGHPLIHEARRVTNDLKISDEKVIIVTGANMAGKSTFLRAIGINTVLMFLGCPVCATRFETSLWRLYTSMRTTDSLKDEESYFLAEIRRLKDIMDVLKEGDPVMVLLDEVLKGTNTTDKQKGSIGLVEKSMNYNILCFIATHDLTLGELEKKHNGKVVNYCFESYIDGMDVTFDYRIRRGIARNMNASFLMKKMGIVD